MKSLIRYKAGTQVVIRNNNLVRKLGLDTVGTVLSDEPPTGFTMVVKFPEAGKNGKTIHPFRDGELQAIY